MELELGICKNFLSQVFLFLIDFFYMLKAWGDLCCPTDSSIGQWLDPSPQGNGRLRM